MIVVYYTKAMVSLCMLMVFIPLVCSAQVCNYRISGKVLDDHKRPAPGIIVHLLHESLGTATDTGGIFSITGVCPGTHIISFDAIGYKKDSLVLSISGD